MRKKTSSFLRAEKALPFLAQENNNYLLNAEKQVKGLLAMKHNSKSKKHKLRSANNPIF